MNLMNTYVFEIVVMPFPTPSAHTSVFIFLLNSSGVALDRSTIWGVPPD
jgi:hypothetical protein